MIEMLTLLDSLVDQYVYPNTLEDAFDKYMDPPSECQFNWCSHNLRWRDDDSEHFCGWGHHISEETRQAGLEILDQWLEKWKNDEAMIDLREWLRTVPLKN